MTINFILHAPLASFIHYSLEFKLTGSKELLNFHVIRCRQFDNTIGIDAQSYILRY